MPVIVVMCGSTTVCVIAAHNAASTALPPSRRTSTAARDAMGCEEMTMPAFGPPVDVAGVFRPKTARSASEAWAYTRVGV